MFTIDENRVSDVFFFFFLFFEKNILMRPLGTNLILWNTSVSMSHIAELGFCGAMLTACYSHQLTTSLSMIFTSSAVAS